MLTLSAIPRLEDENERDLFLEIKSKVNGNIFFSGDFRLIELEVDAAVSNQRVAHHLGYLPTDVHETRPLSGIVTWHFDDFDKTHVSFSTSGATKIRALVGRLRSNG